MVCGVTRSCYTAPCRFYHDAPIGKIRFYFAKEGALWLPFPTVFWPYSQSLELENLDLPGEITGKGLRVWNRGDNVNNLAGMHYEGTPADFLGEGIDPHAEL